MLHIFKTSFIFLRKKSTTTQIPATFAKMSRFLSQQEAIDIDNKLFNDYKFSVDQLMELAGLSVASAIGHYYPVDKFPNVIITCGPGNNGGDGLVCARHLKMFGYNVTIYYPARTDKPLFQNLVKQCIMTDVNVLEPCPSLQSLNEYNLIVDALFGFSFKPPVRENFVEIVNNLRKTKTPICSIDIPSGWHVEYGPSREDFHPETLISLTAPKKCVTFFRGIHNLLGGRFVPQALQDEYNLQLPKYHGTLCYVALKNT